MAVTKNEFVAALTQVASEHNISVEDVISSIEFAVLAAYHKEMPESKDDESISARIDKSTGEVSIYQHNKNITPPGFGRIAAQTAKQVVMQKIRETERKLVVDQYTEQVGSIVRGRVIRVDSYNIIVDLGKAEAVLPKEEQIRNERMNLAETYSFLLKEITPDKYGNGRLILSRSSNEFLEKLFAREVPEIASGSVVIKKLVREPGIRAKVAVTTTSSGVDPVGACVGQRGVRVQTITDEVGKTEKIDIIPWSDDVKQLIKTALSPAKIDTIGMDDSQKLAKVHLAEDQAPLAIGANGVNVNLATKLSGYSIDIVQDGGAASSSPETTSEQSEAVA